jgi:hypothetical protein
VTTSFEGRPLYEFRRIPFDTHTAPWASDSSSNFPAIICYGSQTNPFTDEDGGQVVADVTMEERSPEPGMSSTTRP